MLIGVLITLPYVAYKMALRRGSSEAVAKDKREKYFTLCFKVSIVLIYCLLPVSSALIFETFSCETFDEAGRRLIADLGVRCDSASHFAWQLYAVAMCFIWPIGMQLSLGVLLYRCGDRLYGEGSISSDDGTESNKEIKVDAEVEINDSNEDRGSLDGDLELSHLGRISEGEEMERMSEIELAVESIFPGGDVSSGSNASKFSGSNPSISSEFSADKEPDVDSDADSAEDASISSKDDLAEFHISADDYNHLGTAQKYDAIANAIYERQLRIRDADVTLDHIRLVVDPFRIAMPYWEGVIMTERIFITSLANAFGSDSVFQLSLGLFLVLISALLQAKFEPYRDGSENSFAIASFFIMFLVFFIGMVAKIDAVEYEGADGEVMGKFLVTLTVLVIAGGLIATGAENYYTMQREKKRTLKALEKGDLHSLGFEDGENRNSNDFAVFQRRDSGFKASNPIAKREGGGSRARAQTTWLPTRRRGSRDAGDEENGTARPRSWTATFGRSSGETESEGRARAQSWTRSFGLGVGEPGGDEDQRPGLERQVTRRTRARSVVEEMTVTEFTDGRSRSGSHLLTEEIDFTDHQQSMKALREAEEEMNPIHAGDAGGEGNEEGGTARPRNTNTEEYRGSLGGDRDWISIEKLTTDLKWVERRIMFDEESGALRISTQKVLANAAKIPFTSISYVQVGSENIDDQFRHMVEPLKTMNNSPASIFISAGESSVRIRLPNEEAAQSLATEIRERVYAAKHDGVADTDNDTRLP